jgi:hypothetical protein
VVRAADGSGFVWFTVTFTTLISYEVIKIGKALGPCALEAFFGIQ